jgi:hypothetical protein
MAVIKGPNGVIAEVDSENRLRSFAVTQLEDKYLNVEGGVYSVYFSVDPAGANDYFFYLKNVGLKDLFLTDIRVSSTSPTTLFYDHVTGTPAFVSGQPATVTNRKLGVSTELLATATYDTNITGLTSQGVLFFEECAVADVRYKLSTTSNIIIPQGQAVAFRREAAVGAIEMVVSIVVSE